MQTQDLIFCFRQVARLQIIINHFSGENLNLFQSEADHHYSSSEAIREIQTSHLTLLSYITNY